MSDEWEEKFSKKQNRKFWKNNATGETTWTPPAAASVAKKEEKKKDTSEAVVEWDWDEKYSEKHKKKFWKNKSTGETTWKEPPKPVATVGGTAAAATTASASNKKDTSGDKETSATVEWDWDEKYSEKHKKKFWKNKTTGETTWKEPPKPVATPSALEKKDASGDKETSVTVEWDWDEKYSEKHKKKFWKNKTTGETTWKEPPKPVTIVPTSKNDVSDDKETSATVEWDWDEKYSEKHKKKFWKNKTTGETTWKEPPKPVASVATGVTSDKANLSGDKDDSTVVEWDWDEKYSEKHKKKFWKNKTTGETTWKEPPKPVASTATTLSSSDKVVEVSSATVEWDWDEKYSDKHKKKFWKNKTTGETTWKEPPKPVVATAPTDKKDTTGDKHVSGVVEWDWDEKYSEKHKKKFWKNKTTGETTWKEPPKPIAPIADSKPGDESLRNDSVEKIEEIDDPDWVKHHSKEKNKDYWKNSITGKSSWTQPPKIKKIKSADNKSTEDDSANKKDLKVEKKSKEKKSSSEAIHACGFVYQQQQVAHRQQKDWIKLAAKLFTFGGETVIALYSSSKDCIYDDITASEKELAVMKNKNESESSGKKKDDDGSNGNNDVSVLESPQPTFVIYLRDFSTVSSSREVSGEIILTKAVVEVEKASTENKVDNENQDAQHLNVSVETKLGLQSRNVSSSLIDVRFSCVTAEASHVWVKRIIAHAPHLKKASGADCPAGPLETMNFFVLVNLLAASPQDECEHDLQWLHGYALSLKECNRESDSVSSSMLDVALKVAQTALQRQCMSLPIPSAITWKSLPWSGLVVVSFSHEPSQTISLSFSSSGTNLTSRPSEMSMDRSLWLVVNPEKHRLLFYDRGLSSKATIIVDLQSAAGVDLLPLTATGSLRTKMSGCQCDGKNVSIVFSFPTSVEYWQWNCMLFLASERRVENSRVSSSSIGKSFVWSKDMLNFSMQAIDRISDRNMIRQMLKTVHMSGQEACTIKYTHINGRIIVHKSSVEGVVEGSVLISLNELSCIGLPGRELMKLISEIPVHLPVKLVLWQFPRESMRCCAVLDFEDEMVTGDNGQGDWMAPALSTVPFDMPRVSIEMEVEKPDSLTKTSNAKIRRWSPQCEVLIEGGRVTVIDQIKSRSENACSVSISVADMRIRLIDIGRDNCINASLNFAIQIQDKTSQTVLTAHTVKGFVCLCSKLLEAMKLLGGLEINLPNFYDRCVEAQKEKAMTHTRVSQFEVSLNKFVSPHSQSNYDSDSDSDDNATIQQENNFKGANINDVVQIESQVSEMKKTRTSSCRLEVIAAAESLERLLDSFKLPPTFPSIASIYKTLESLESMNLKNHESIRELLKLEAAISDSEGESELENDGFEQTYEDEHLRTSGQLPSSKFSSSMTMDELVADRESHNGKGSPDEFNNSSNVAINPQFSKSTDSTSIQSTSSATKLTRSDSISRVNSNSSVIKDSPTVFVPPADMSKDRRTIRNIVPNSSLRRPSVQDVTVNLVSNDINEEAPLLPISSPSPPNLVPTLAPPPPPPPPPPPKTSSSDSKVDHTSPTIQSSNVIDGEAASDKKESPLELKVAETISVVEIENASKDTAIRAPFSSLTPEVKEAPKEKTLDEVAQEQSLELSDNDKQRCAELLIYLRDHPDHLVEMASQCKNVLELAEFVKVVTTRIYCHWSSTIAQFVDFLRVAIDSHDSNEIPRMSATGSEVLSSQASESLLLPLIFNELFLRPDMLGFIRYISDAVGQNGRVFLNREGSVQDINTLCALVIEPIALRFDALSISRQIPGALSHALEALCSTKNSGAIDARRILLLVDSFVPRIVQWLYRDTTDRHFSVNAGAMDGEDLLAIDEHAAMIDITQELLKLCFVNGFNSCMMSLHPDEMSSPYIEGEDLRNSLSLSHHAALARSKWMITRFISACITHATSIPETQDGDLTSLSNSPVRLLAEFAPGTIKPLVSMSCFSLRASELYMLLNRCDDLLHRTQNTKFSATDSRFQQIISDTKQLRSGSTPMKWKKQCRDKVFVLQRQVDFQSRLDNSEIVEIQGSRELTSLLWLLNASRSSLRHLYQSVPDVKDNSSVYDLPSNPTILRELTSLHDKLCLRRNTVERILSDISFLKQVEKLFSVYDAEIKLLVALGHHQYSIASGPRHAEIAGPSTSGSTDNIRSPDEYMTSLSKACQQELEVEKELNNFLKKIEKNHRGEDSVLFSTLVVNQPDIEEKNVKNLIHTPSSSSNPLLLVLRNVF